MVHIFLLGIFGTTILFQYTLILNDIDLFKPEHMQNVNWRNLSVKLYI